MASSALLQTVLRGAILKAKASGKTPTAVLEAVLLSRFNAELSNGKTIVSISEAGGTTSFQLPGNLSPDKIAMLINDALGWLEAQEDPNNPDLSSLNTTRRIKGVFDTCDVPL